MNTGRAHRSAAASRPGGAASPVSALGSILHVHAPGEVGGAGRVLQLLASTQQKAGHDVTVAVVLDRGDDGARFCDPIEAAGVRTRRWQVPPRRYDEDHRRVTALCRELGPGVVHTHGYRADVVAARAARRLGIPVVSTAHGFTGGDWKNRLFQRLQCGSFRKADAVIAVSKRLADDLRQRDVPVDRIHVVPNAYPDDEPRLPRATARERLGVPDDRVHVGWVGRISPEKGLDVLLDALSNLEDLPITVSVVGDGPDRPSLRDRVSAAAADRVLWHGGLPDAGALFPAFDLFVLSSRTEGTPMVLFEAMAAEVPIVATAVGGVPDVVSDVEAVLTPPEDPVALASAIRRALADHDAAAARARAAKRRLTERFGVGPWLERHADVYRQARASRP